MRYKFYEYLVSYINQYFTVSFFSISILDLNVHSLRREHHLLELKLLFTLLMNQVIHLFSKDLPQLILLISIINAFSSDKLMHYQLKKSCNIVILSREVEISTIFVYWLKWLLNWKNYFKHYLLNLTDPYSIMLLIRIWLMFIHRHWNLTLKIKFFIFSIKLWLKCKHDWF